MTTILYDLETDGLLKKMTRIHLLIMKDAEGNTIDVYRKNDEMDNIEEGIRRLEEADIRGGHNIIRFDELAIKKIYPWYNPKGKAVDTLVLSRVLFPEIKQRDFVLNRKGVLPGQLIGSHSLDAWGYRLGLAKGDYSKQMLAKGLDPWAKWNQEMEDYAVRDVEITAILWAGLMKDLEKWGWDPQLEHDIHDLTGYMERNGFPFDRAAALKLRDQLEAEFTRLVKEAQARYGYWYGPEKKKIIRPLYPNAPIPEGKNITYAAPNTEWGEDESRAIWADITFPKINRKSQKLGDMSIGSPFCKIVRKDFNPASRQHIIDRFTVIHQWSPEDFTENGNPSVDDSVLQKLKDRIPEAGVLADILFHQKILGQLSNGAQAWLNTRSTRTMVGSTATTMSAEPSRDAARTSVRTSDRYRLSSSRRSTARRSSRRVATVSTATSAVTCSPSATCPAGRWSASTCRAWSSGASPRSCARSTMAR